MQHPLPEGRLHRDPHRSPRLPQAGAQSTLEGNVRIAFVVSSLTLGGVQRTACETASYLAGYGRDVTLITPTSREHDFFTPHPEVLRPALGIAEPPVGPRGLGNLRTVQRTLRARYSELGVDCVVVFADGTGLGAAAVTPARRARIPVVAVAAGDPATEPRGAYLKALQRAEVIVAPTVQTATAVGRAVTRSPRVEVIPPPLPRHSLSSDDGSQPAGAPLTARPLRAAGPGVSAPAQRYSSTPPRTANRVLAVGSLRPHNGFDLLLRAFGRIRTEFPDWSLRIVGHGPEQPALEALGEKLRLGRALEFIPPTDTVATQYREAEIFALPSRSEVFALPLLEAMAAGSAVAAFDCPTGPREIIGHRSSGILVPAGKTEIFAEELGELMMTPRLRRHLGRRAPEAVAGHHPERVMQGWERLLHRLTSKAARRAGRGAGTSRS